MRPDSPSRSDEDEQKIRKIEVLRTKAWKDSEGTMVTISSRLTPLAKEESHLSQKLIVNVFSMSVPALPSGILSCCPIIDKTVFHEQHLACTENRQSEPLECLSLRRCRDTQWYF